MAAVAPGRLIVKFADGAPVRMVERNGRVSTGITSLDVLSSKYAVSTLSQPFSPQPRTAKAKNEYDRLGLGRVYVLTADPGADIGTMVCDYAADPNVEYAEPDHVGQAQYVPNDTEFGRQWGLENDGVYPQWHPGTAGADVHAKEAWDVYQIEHYVVVAILDTGTDLDHPDFWWSYPNDGVIVSNQAECLGTPGVDDDGNGYTDDCHGFDFVNGTYTPELGWCNDADGPEDDDHNYAHGTHVSGLVGAISNNGIGVSSLLGGRYNPQLLLPVKVMKADRTYFYSTLEAGIYYAVSNNASVINMSLGGTANTTTLQAAIDYAWNQGCVPVAAMGNYNNSTVLYPAGYAHTIAVGATDTDDSRCNEGDWGSCFGSHIDVVAPGNYIWSTFLGGSYGGESGTSMATPLVSGLVGMIMSKTWPEPSPARVLQVLQLSSDDMVGLGGEDTSGFDQYMGWGRINAERAMYIQPMVLFGDDFADGNISDWTITNHGAVADLDGTTYYSPPYSLRFQGAVGMDQWAVALSPVVDFDNAQPYEISTRFRYESFHWDQSLMFGHVRLLLDSPGMPLRYDPVGDCSYQSVPGSASFESYLPPGTWGLITVTVDPGTRTYTVSINDNQVGQVTYQASVVPTDRFYMEDNPDQTNFLNANYDDFGVNVLAYVMGIRSGEPGAVRLVLDQNAPNPFSGATSISYVLPKDAMVALRAYDVAGRIVRTLVDGPQTAGPHSVRWISDGGEGARLPQGVYFYRLEVNRVETASRKALLIR
jgi:hypothetical protein